MASAPLLLFSFLVVLLQSHSIHAQQFEDLQFAVSYPQLSESCVEALNTTVGGCPGLLMLVAQKHRYLHHDELTDICTTDCRSSLASVRAIIALACNAASDVVEIAPVTYPGAWAADKGEAPS